jgi:hypothetical protein
MHHKPVLSRSTVHGKTVRIQCSCGVGGDFDTVPEAIAWIQNFHFNRLGGVSTSELPEVPKDLQESPSKTGQPEPDHSHAVNVTGPDTGEPTIGQPGPPPQPESTPAEPTTPAEPEAQQQQQPAEEEKKKQESEAQGEANTEA